MGVGRVSTCFGGKYSNVDLACVGAGFVGAGVLVVLGGDVVG